MEELFGFLIKKEVEYKRNQPMSQYTSVRIGGCVSVVAFPSTQQQLIDVVHFLHISGIKYKVIGQMTNVLPCDGEYRGVLVSTKRLNSYIGNGAIFTVECGVLLSSLIFRLARIGFGGAEGLCGIPGSLGGMIVSNAGAYGREIGDLVRRVDAYSPGDDRLLTFTRAECRFAYRSSIFSKADTVILSAELEFTRRDSEIIIDEMGKIKHKRARTQPIDRPSLGSVFKKANGVSAAQIIDRCGLKGLSVGGAMVSPKHAGFIVNAGNATASDYRDLIELIKREVYNKCGAVLEEEIEYI